MMNPHSFHEPEPLDVESSAESSELQELGQSWLFHLSIVLIGLSH